MVNRDEGSAVIVQRIIGSDAAVLSHLNYIFSSMCLSQDPTYAPKLPEMIEMFGWQIVQEILLVVLLHEFHEEASRQINIRSQDLDRRALTILTASVEAGASPIAALFANIGEVQLAVHDMAHGKILFSGRALAPEDRLSLERAAYGFDHGVLSSFFLSEVDFPQRLCDEVFEHPTVGSPIWIGERLAADLTNAKEQDTPFHERPLWKATGFSKARLKRLERNILNSAELPYVAFSDSHLAA